MAVLAIAIILIIRSTENNEDTQKVEPSAPAVSVDSGNDNENDNEQNKVAFEDLTKEEAIAFLEHRSTDSRELIPADYVGKEVTNAIIMDGNTIVSNLSLIYSYGDLAELEEMARKQFDPSFGLSDDPEEASDFEIKEYAYYAIVTPERAKGATECDHGYSSDCNSLLSFKRDYLNYYSEETSPNSFNDVAYVNTRDPEIVSKLLRTFNYLAPSLIGHGNIYSYSFEEQDDKFVLTTACVGVGFDLERIQAAEEGFDWSDAYAINLYYRRYAMDKADGHIYAIPARTEPETSYFDTIKSIPLTETEAMRLF